MAVNTSILLQNQLSPSVYQEIIVLPPTKEGKLSFKDINSWRNSEKAIVYVDGSYKMNWNIGAMTPRSFNYLYSLDADALQHSNAQKVINDVQCAKAMYIMDLSGEPVTKRGYTHIYVPDFGTSTEDYTSYSDLLALIRQRENQILKEQRCLLPNPASAAVHQIRTDFDYSQSEFAKAAGINKTTLTKLEHGGNVNIATLQKIAEATNRLLTISFE